MKLFPRPYWTVLFRFSLTLAVAAVSIGMVGSLPARAESDSICCRPRGLCGRLAARRAARFCLPPTAESQPAEAEPAVPEVLFDGRSPGHWKPITEQDFTGGDSVKVEDGAIRIAPGSPASGIRWAGPDLPRMNYELTLQAQKTAGDDFFCGLTFPVGESYCTLIVGGWGGGVVGLSNVDNYSAAENSTSSYKPFEKDRWYDIRLRVTDDRIGVWIDDEPMIDLETEGHQFSIWWEQEPARPLGVATWYTGSALKNIRLKKVEPTPSDAESP